MESMNAGLSLGRLDQWLQPFFVADIKKLKTAKQRDEYVRHSVELIGNLFMRCTDHFPLTPDFANFYFGGSSSAQALTVGGITPDGKDAVNDMTYIFLKVTELLSIRDPKRQRALHAGRQQRYLPAPSMRSEPYYGGYSVQCTMTKQ